MSTQAWWVAEMNGHRGYVPSNYVELLPRVRATTSAPSTPITPRRAAAMRKVQGMKEGIVMEVITAT
jgi:hypothetical protein